MADTKAKEIFMGALEVIATHQVMKYVKQGDDQEPLRILTGAGMGALGFMYGPELYDRIRHKDFALSTELSRKAAYTAGGAVGGALLGYLVGPKFFPESGIQPLPRNLGLTIAEATPKEGIIEKPHGLFFTASSVYLAYALFFNGKSDEQRVRHTLMLGAGALGYAYGPELIAKTKDLAVSKGLVDDALDRYNKAVAAGIAGGALLGYFKGEDIMDRIMPKKDGPLNDPEDGR